MDDITQDEFRERFVACMVLRAGQTQFSDGSSIADYARDAAPTYWEDEDLRAEGPEACAEIDISYWGG